jgi:Mor family transcriptional regulator
MPTTSLTDLIAFEDLSPDMRLVAESCGMDVAITLIRNCPGISIYVPRADKMTALVRRYIQQRYEGRSIGEAEIKQLAIELQKSPSFVRQVVRMGGG